jgi:methyl-accepting chemotaxis protein
VITDRASKARQLIEQVRIASRQQSEGCDQVSETIAHLGRVTDATTRCAQESAATSDELAQQADQTMAVVARLEAMVGRTRSLPHAIAVTR